MRKRSALAGLLALCCVFGVGAYLRKAVSSEEQPGTLLPTGKFISPIGDHVDVGSYPANLAVSPDRKFVVVTNTGFRQQLTVLNAETGAVVDTVEFNKSSTGELQALYYGLAFSPKDGRLYVSNGPEDKVSVFKMGADGKLAEDGVIEDPSDTKGQPNFVAGLAFDATGETLFTAHNEAYRSRGLTSSISAIKLDGSQARETFELPGFPFAVAAVDGEGPQKSVYVTCERDGVVARLPGGRGPAESIRTGMQPTSIVYSASKNRLYVSNSGSDTISIIDPGRNRVVKTILTRPAALRGLAGSTPLGLALASDNDLNTGDTKLFVALADMNAVGVIDLKQNRLLGYIPVGWYPTAVAVVGNNMFVANAKGHRGANPNDKPVGEKGTYIENIIEGTVSRIDLRQVRLDLPRLTTRVLANNFAGRGQARDRSKAFKNPGIKHVIYVLKENRTYDQVLGDDPRGNGDPSLLMFGKPVTPNQHALAERFVLLDNFNVCAEVSADGWQWSTAGMTSEYTSRNAPFNYSGRGRDYDFEGQTNGVTADLVGIPDVSDVPGGYIWDACLRHKIDFRNYGFYVDPISKEDAKAGGVEIAENGPTKKALLAATDSSFRQYDLYYADSDLWKVYDAPEPRLLQSYGKRNAPSRFSEWKLEFDEMVAKGKMPRLMMVRFCRDHTAGTTPGLATPAAMVADNDYAVGQLVEAVSNSPFWKDTAIFIIEDDAQAGRDHVDSHRSICFIASPFVRPGFVDSRFYNTDSVLRTIELLLGIKPMNQYDAVAAPFMVFDAKPVNSAPFRALLPDRDISSGVNKSTDYRAKDSERLISRYREESMPDLELNDILWRATRGNDSYESAAPISVEPEEDDD